MADKELRELAVNANEDFYDLLEISASASDSDIKRAYRRLALRYHPDKVVGGDPIAAADKFHSLKIAHDALLEPEIRQLYDNSRRAKQQKQAREAAYDTERREMVNDLLRREREAAQARGAAPEATPHGQHMAQMKEESRKMREAYVAKKFREEQERLREEEQEEGIADPVPSIPRNQGATPAFGKDREEKYRSFWEQAEAGLKERMEASGGRPPKFASFKGLGKT